MLIQNAQPKICAGYEPIAGYRVQSLLGRGGFGEVWSCEAPGGLKKAIKFIHGAMDQDRAARELKSLNRIKTVQHPFLLTLERFDFVDERLVIITELADGTLEDEFARHQARGSCGIPRDQLLSNLGDAAEALDYLHQRHGLQHLDVKPGNLLLLGDHVKVADFGLLKDLKEIECSIVGGLTPVYAPPELFDGRPTMHSDQYSLAVMFQELLTGVRPFGGRTIAQLATQHVHSAPNLNPLLPSDRPIMARALEKNPDRRFGSCREFISALRKAADSPARVGGVLSGIRRAGDTSLGEFSGAANVPVAKVSNLPCLDVGARIEAGDTIKHALIVGLGGLGGECLRGVAERVKQYSHGCPLVVHGLLIDTDAEAIRDADFIDLGAGPSSLRTLHVPLKKPQQYRELRGKRFRSISRRWIYNIPRSGSTEGLRPLGRLALLDHSEKVQTLLLSLVEELAELRGDEIPSVYVAGAIDGGTASGMVYDVMHLLRDALDRSGMENAVVLPLLATGSLQPDSQRALAGHNAACALAEMRHLINIANGYPGDEAVGWPSIPAARSPLADAYVIARGLPGDAKPSPADTLSEYIWVNSTYGAEILAAARRVAQEPALDRLLSPSLRSVGIVRLGSPKTIEESLDAPMITRQLLTTWIGDDACPGDAIEPIAEQLAERCQMTTPAILQYCLGQWSMDRDERVGVLDHWLTALAPAVLADPEKFNSVLRGLADSTLGSPEQHGAVADLPAVRRELGTKLTNRRMNLRSAIAVVDTLIEVARSGQRQMKTRQASESTSSDGAERPSSREIAQLSERWLWRSVCENAAHILAGLSLELKSLRDDLAAQAETFRHCITGVSARLQGRGTHTWQAMSQSWRDRAEEIVSRLHQSVASPLLSQPVLDRQAKISGVNREGVLQYLINKSVPLVVEMSVYCAARQPDASDGQDDAASERSQSGLKSWDSASASSGIAGRWSCQLSPHDAARNSIPLSGAGGETPASRDWSTVVAAALQAVRPVLLDCGGSQRMLLLVGGESERAQLEPKVKAGHVGPVTTVVIPGIDATLICEAQNINLNDLRSRIMTATGGREDVLARLHSRCDIPWS